MVAPRQARNRGCARGTLRFFYGTLGRKDIADQLSFARKEDTLPAVLTQDEVLRLLKPARRRGDRATISILAVKANYVQARTIKTVHSKCCHNWSAWVTVCLLFESKVAIRR